LTCLYCKDCKKYWEDSKYCPHKKIFLPKIVCKDFEEKKDEIKYVKYREEYV